MKKIIPFIIIAIISAASHGLYAQCTPGDSISCPDPENNGEICPDSLPLCIENVYYSVDITILPPPDAPFGAGTVPVHHIELIDVGNLPTGLSWVSNATGNIFYPGTYYCVLVDGTSSSLGSYPLKITVGVYLTIIGNPTYVGDQIDSTSVILHVVPATGIDEGIIDIGLNLRAYPNPFENQINIEFNSTVGGHATIEMIDISGRVVYSSPENIDKGDNDIELHLSDIDPGMYMFRMIIDGQSYSSRLIKLE